MKTLADILLRMSDNAFRGPQVITRIKVLQLGKRMIALDKEVAPMIANKLAKMNDIYHNKELGNTYLRFT